MASSTNSSGGIGFFGLLAIVFIVLKLVAVQPVASWSWIWVLSPIWGPTVLFIVILAVYFLYKVAQAAIKSLYK